AVPVRLCLNRCARDDRASVVLLRAWDSRFAASLGSRRAATADRPSATDEGDSITKNHVWGAVSLLMAWERRFAAWLHRDDASLGSRRVAIADRPSARDDSSERLVVLLMAWESRVAAGLHTVAASLGSRRAATADRP